MFDVVKITTEQYNTLMDEVIKAELDLSGPIVLHSPNFTIYMKDSSWVFSFLREANKTLHVSIYDKQTGQRAGFKTTKPIELEWSSTLQFDVVVWEEKSNKDIVDFFSCDLSDTISGVPSILKGHLHRFNSIIRIFENVNKSLACSAHLWNTQVIEDSPEDRLLKAIYGNTNDFKKSYLYTFAF